MTAYWGNHIHPNFISKPTGQRVTKMKFTGESHQTLSLWKLIFGADGQLKSPLYDKLKINLRELLKKGSP
jgi:hypothetical protein